MAVSKRAISVIIAWTDMGVRYGRITRCRKASGTQTKSTARARSSGQTDGGRRGTSRTTNGTGSESTVTPTGMSRSASGATGSCTLRGRSRGRARLCKGFGTRAC